MSDLMTAPRWKIWALVFVFWTLLGLSYTASSVISMISEGEVFTWTRPFTWNLTNAYLWMLLTPVVAWLGSIGGHGGWRRFWAVHLPASIGLAALQVMLVLAIYWTLCGPPLARPNITFGAFSRMQFAYNFHLSWLTYGVMLVVLRAIDSQRRLCADLQQLERRCHSFGLTRSRTGDAKFTAFDRQRSTAPVVQVQLGHNSPGVTDQIRYLIGAATGRSNAGRCTLNPVNRALLTK